MCETCARLGSEFGDHREHSTRRGWVDTTAPGYWSCGGCGCCTKKVGEYYMVHCHIWRQVYEGVRFLCVACVETRLGRELSPEDFTDAPLNGFPTASPMMALRSGRPWDPSSCW